MMRLAQTNFLVIITTFFYLTVWSTTISGTRNDATERKKIQLEKNLFNMNNLADLRKIGVLLPAERKPVIGRSGPVKAPAALTAYGSTDSVNDAIPGKCDPKPVCISNPLTADLNSNQLAFPPCINIHRCDGCCPTNEKCTAIRSHDVKLQKVGVISVEGENQLRYEDKMITVQNHTECQCQCQWETDDDCRRVNKNYVRSINQCECECANEDLSCDSRHEFDRESCSCKCRRDKYGVMENNCKADRHKATFVWRDDTCICEPIRGKVTIN